MIQMIVPMTSQLCFHILDCNCFEVICDRLSHGRIGISNGHTSLVDYGGLIANLASGGYATTKQRPIMVGHGNSWC